MGSWFSVQDRVEPANESRTELHNVSKMSNNSGTFTGPVKNRSCTDVIFLFLLACFLISLGVLVGYCGYYGDIYRIVNGYDNCGNVCGMTNRKEESPRFSCKGTDMRQRTFLQIKEASRVILYAQNINRECVQRCEPDFREFLNRCIPKPTTSNVNSFFSKTGLSDFIQEAAEDLSLCWEEILYLCLISLVFSIIIMMLFRFLVGIVVWLVLIGVTLVSIIATIYLWVLYKQKIDENYYQRFDKEMHKRKEWSFLAYAIVASVVTILVLLVILVMRKRIKLVIQLFREAGKAINSMPLLLVEPLITFAALGCVVAIWVVFSLLVESSGLLTAPQGNTAGPLSYDKDGAMKFTRWYNLLGLFWLTQFCIGCQHMVIAGAVATWFFTRNKSALDSPISQSFSNLVRYHLGSVAMGSLLIALVQLVRVALKGVQYQLQGHDNVVSKCMFRACQCCLYCFEKFLQYLSRNSYIETAMYGHSFCKAGQQAFRLLSSNALRVIAINSVGDFVLFLGKALVVIATVLIGIEMLDNKEGIHHVWVPLSLAGIFAYLVTHCFLTVYEMAIDTIFLCFCEDCEQNDGLNRPYYMSRGLMEFVQNSKKALEILDDSPTNNIVWSAGSGDSGSRTRTVSENLK